MTRIEREWRATHLAPRRTHRKDVNHAEIAAALRSVGALVIDTSSLGLFVDLVCAYHGEWIIIEVKNPDTHYGRSGLNANQIALAAAAGSAPVHVVSSVDEALKAIGALA